MSALNTIIFCVIAVIGMTALILVVAMLIGDRIASLYPDEDDGYEGFEDGEFDETKHRYEGEEPFR